jgi:hypothetical protein
MINLLFGAFCAFGGYKIWQGSSSITARFIMYMFLSFLIFLWFQY